LPATVDPRLADALRKAGIEQLYSHQGEAFELIEDGKNVVIVTPTASGTTLCYNLPVLNALLADPDACALYLFPTKALSEDQLSAFNEMVDSLGSEIRAFTYDGDTPGDARRAIRRRANVVLTNPDMLHAGILPHHTKWARFFGSCATSWSMSCTLTAAAGSHSLMSSGGSDASAPSTARTRNSSAARRRSLTPASWPRV
jgi:DEAD/DEAH box helicase domain-containing protein